MQATRQSLLKKYGEIRHAMDRLHNTRLSNYERLECLDEIRRWAERVHIGGGQGQDFMHGFGMKLPFELLC
jgi:hypothetical protein